MKNLIIVEFCCILVFISTIECASKVGCSCNKYNAQNLYQDFPYYGQVYKNVEDDSAISGENL